jgi:hypothetical protein
MTQFIMGSEFIQIYNFHIFGKKGLILSAHKYSKINRFRVFNTLMIRMNPRS